MSSASAKRTGGSSSELAMAAQADPLQEFVRTHFAELTGMLARELEGLQMYVAWVPKKPHRGMDLDLPHSCSRCPNAASRCANHAETLRMIEAPEVRHESRWFTCVQGVRNLWLPIVIQSRAVGIIYIQVPAPDVIESRPSGSGRSSRLLQGGTHGMSRSRYASTARLLRLVVDNIEAATTAKLNARELETSQLETLKLHRENSRLRRIRPQRKTNTPHEFTPCKNSGHRDRIVQVMIDYLHAHYRSPMQLGDVASAMRMNPSYLSSVFSKTMGVTFHHYLEELRLERSKELLKIPTLHICEIACDSGYASAGHFWRVFKSRTGLSPRAWRDCVLPDDTYPF